MRLIGVNAAGISSKLASFEYMLNELKPGVFFIEETKVKKQGTIRTETAEKYVIFELIRKEKSGGGLALGVAKELNPTWLGEGDDQVEVLSVQINAKDFPIRCVGGYSPQENDPVERKSKFWARLDSEVYEAEKPETGFILQMDGNLWAGRI